MARIEVSCPRCGIVRRRARDFELRRWIGTGTYYVFTCPKCRILVQKPADQRAVEILLASGVKSKMFDVPAELTEPRGGPPLTYDDLIDLHHRLEDPDWFNDFSSRT